MSEMTLISSDELTRLQQRTAKLAQDKSYLQLIINLINKVSAAHGLDSMVQALLGNILDVIGGTNIILYYRIDDDLYYADLLGAHQKLARLDDDLVKTVFAEQAPLEIEHAFEATQMLTADFSKAYTWLFPLRTGQELVGVIKLENLHIGMRELYSELPTFFTYVASVLQNEISGQTRLSRAYAQLNEINEELEQEIGEREQAEDELRQTRDELDEQVRERTLALHQSNELLQRELVEHKQAEEEIARLNRELEGRVTSRSSDLDMKRLELEESQRALMNIVEDLNLKTEELEEANAKLLELDRLKSLFIASMSHELRTPLNSIIGFSSIIRDEWLGPVNQEQRENLDTVLRSGKHLLSLINDVIDVSKIEAGRIEARFEEFDLYDLMIEAVQYIEKDLGDKGLELHLDLCHHPLRTDRRRLLQCVINLLSNAVKFTERGSISVVALHQSTGTIAISVRDTGVGIAEEDIARLFKPFVRLESPLKTIATGTGLGLYLTMKLVVEVLRGDILCESDLGTGSTFTITIPEQVNEKSIGSRG